MCFNKKEKEPNKANDKRNFFTKKYMAFSPKIIGIQFFLSFVFLIVNIVAMTQLKQNRSDEDGDDFEKAQNLIDVITGDDRVGGLFKRHQENCQSCDALKDYFYGTYKDSVIGIVKSQNDIFDFNYNKQALIIYSTGISIIVLVFAFIKTKPILEKVYLSFDQLMCKNLNVDVYLLHAIKYSTVFDGCCKKYKLWIFLVKKILVEFIFVLYSLIFIFQIIKSCSSGGADDESNKLIELVENVLKETNKTEDQIFRFKHVIFSIKFIRDTFASCSASSFFSYMYSDFWQAYSMSQFIYEILNTIYEVIDQTCFRKKYVSHYKLDESAKNLVAVPNEQEDEEIPLYSESEQQSKVKKQGRLANCEQLPLEKTNQNNISLDQYHGNNQSLSALNPLPYSNNMNTTNNSSNQSYNQSRQSLPVVYSGQMVQDYYKNSQGAVVYPQGQQGYYVMCYNPQTQMMQPVYYTQQQVNYYASQNQQNLQNQSHPQQIKIMINQ